jgi:hypothetical protein
MAAGVSNKGTLGEADTTSTGAHMSVGWKMFERDEPTMDPERRETKNKSEKVCVSSMVGHISVGMPLILLQVNSRSICHKVLEFWNLIHITPML